MTDKEKLEKIVEVLEDKEKTIGTNSFGHDIFGISDCQYFKVAEQILKALNKN